MIDLRYDGAAHHYAVVRAGMVGRTESRHGAPNRWDWSLTARDIAVAQEKHRRLQALADGLTPAQRAALWADPSPQSAVLRRFVR